MKGYQVVLVVLSLVLVGIFCLRPPAFPRWDTTLNIPLYQSTFRLVDFLDSTRFQVQPDSTINFACDFPIDTVTPEGVIDLVSVDETSRIALGDFMFTDIPKGHVGMSLEQLIGMPVPDSGLKQAVPPFEMTLLRECSLPGVANAEVMLGVMRTTLSNQTGIPIDSVVICLPLGKVRFGNVQPRTTQSSRADIGGVHICSPMSVVISLGSAGTGADTVRLLKSDSLLLEVMVDSLQVSNARVRIPIAKARRLCRVSTGSSQPFKIDSLTLASGLCRITLANDFDVPVNAELTVPKLSKSQDYRIRGHHSTVVEFDLSGMRIDNRSKTNSLLDFEVIAVPDPSEELVDLTKHDGLVIGYETRQLKPVCIAGEFQRPVYAASVLETLPQLIPYGIKGLRVPNAELMLDIENSIGFPLELQLGLVAHRDGEEAARLDRLLVVPAGEFGAPRAFESVLGVTDLVNAGADFIIFEHTVRMTGRGSYTSGAWVAGRAAMCTPLRLAFVSDTVAGPTKSVQLQQSHRNLIAEHLVGGEVKLSVANQFPTGFAGWLAIAPDSTAAPDPDVLVDEILVPFGVPTGRLDHLGNCVGESDTVVQFFLDSLEATLFRRSPLKAQLFLVLEPTDTLNFRTTDHLRIGVLVELRVRVKQWGRI